jgi:UDP-glucose 4-epimerase
MSNWQQPCCVLWNFALAQRVFMAMSKVLVTGGAGFIGSHVVDALIGEGHEVLVLDNFSTGRKENVNAKATIAEVDITDYEKLRPLFRDREAVFHLAAEARIQPSIENPLSSERNNIAGTLNVLWAAKEAGVKKVIYSASSSVYGNQERYPVDESMEPHPKNPYAVTKLVGELYAALLADLYKLPTVSLRYFNVYGPRQLADGPYATVIGIFLKQKKDGLPLTIVGTGEKRRDFTHVRDVVRANLLAWKKDEGRGSVYNIGTGKNYNVNEVAAFVGGATTTLPDRPGEATISLADNAKAKQFLGWKPHVSLQEGIAELKKIHNLV